MTIKQIYLFRYELFKNEVFHPKCCSTPKHLDLLLIIKKSRNTLAANVSSLHSLQIVDPFCIRRIKTVEGAAEETTSSCQPGFLIKISFPFLPQSKSEGSTIKWYPSNEVWNFHFKKVKFLKEKYRSIQHRCASGFLSWEWIRVKLSHWILRGILFKINE